MKEIIVNRNIVLFFLIITTSAFAFDKVEQDVGTLSNYAQTNYRLRSWMPNTIVLNTNDGEVILENFDHDKADQLITAFSSSGLEIIGNSEMESVRTKRKRW